MRKYRVPLAILYILLAVWTTGATMADMQHDLSDNFRRLDYRHDLALAVFIGATPVGWIAALFATGFYEAGWTLQCRCSKERDSA